MLPTSQHKRRVYLQVQSETVLISPVVSLSAATACTPTSCFSPGVKSMMCCVVSFVVAVPLPIALAHVTMNPELLPVGLVQEREIDDVVLTTIMRFWTFSGSVRRRRRERRFKSPVCKIFPYSLADTHSLHCTQQTHLLMVSSRQQFEQ